MSVDHRSDASARPNRSSARGRSTAAFGADASEEAFAVDDREDTGRLPRSDREDTGRLPRARVQQAQGQAKPSRRVDSLDGLRAIAIISVLIYHLHLPFLPSGHLGVVMFLVLSGYLVTSSLLRSYGRDHQVSRVKFLVRRFQRIWPSVLFMVAGVAAITTGFNHILLTKLRPDVIPSLTFSLNWAYIFRDVSYFDNLGATSPVLHLWYVALSEQFVLIWAIIAPWLFERGRRFAGGVTLLLAAVSAVLMAVLYVPGADPSRVYYGLDTRAFSLLLGALMAILWPSWRRLPLSLRRSDSANGWATFFGVLGLLSLAALVAGMVLLPADSDLLYRGGMVLASVLTMLVIGGCLTCRGPLNALLACAPLRVIGERSYALYLWHYPIFCMLDAGLAKVEWWVKPLALLLSVGAAELSYRLVEQPFSPAKGAQDGSGSRRALQVIAGLICAGALGYGVWGLINVPDEFLVPEDAIVSTGVGADEAMQVEKPQFTPAPDSPTTGAPTTSMPETPATTPASTQPIPEIIATITAPDSELAAGHYDPVLIGDSVPGDAYLDTLFPNALIDTYVGRMPAQALSVLQDYIAQGVVGETVILDAFSNTTPMIETLESMVEACGPERTIYLVGVVEPEGFQDEANANLMQIADKYDNVEFIDWLAICAGHEGDYLYGDKTHLTPTGIPVYRQMLAHAVAEHMQSKGAVVTAYEGTEAPIA